jgi:hypothetical protein
VPGQKVCRLKEDRMLRGVRVDEQVKSSARSSQAQDQYENDLQIVQVPV